MLLTRTQPRRRADSLGATLAALSVQYYGGLAATLAAAKAPARKAMHASPMSRRTTR